MFHLFILVFIVLCMSFCTLISTFLYMDFQQDAQPDSCRFWAPKMLWNTQYFFNQYLTNINVSPRVQSHLKLKKHSLK